MKRKAECEDQPNKRSRPTDPEDGNDFFKLQEIDAGQLVQNGIDVDGYITARVFMAWSPIGNKHRALIETSNAHDPSPKAKHRFEICFSGVCADHFNVLELKAMDQVQVLLKGATLQKTAKPIHQCSLAMKLCYEDGVVLKFLKRREGIEYDGQPIDTWKLKEAKSICTSNDWYSTPVPRPHLELKPVPEATKPQKGSIHSAPDVQLPISNYPPAIAIQPTNAILPSQAEPQSDDAKASHIAAISDAPRLSKRAQKRLGKELRKKQAAEVKASPNGVVLGTNNLDRDSLPALSVASQLEPATASTAPIGAQSSGEIRIKARLRTSSHTYEPIKRFEAGRVINLIGVVTNVARPSKTRSGEWSCSLKVVDPTVVDTDVSDLTEFRVNCFSKKHKEWLPDPDEDDVVVLRNIKTSQFNSTITGVGFSDRHQWAIFSPKTGQMHYGDRGSAPESEVLADGMGLKYTPFCSYGEEEIKECLKLSDAWRMLKKRREAERGVVQRIGGSSLTSLSPKPQRQHKVIRDAGPEVPPSGWFDCTVEVLYGHMNDNGVYSVYVTDYTANPECPPVQASWCPPSLASYVLKVEMWDAAAEIGPTLHQHEYYTMKNLRMRISQGNYLEAKAVEGHKIFIADKGSPYLRALLDRKRQWELDMNASSSAIPEFEHRLFKDISSLDSHFNCTVEVLHAIDGTVNTNAYLYVTDYTQHPEFACHGLKESWARNLDGYIHKILLLDEQAELVKGLIPGSFCTIMRLRLRRSREDGIVSGYLAGKQRCIQRLNPHNATKEDLQKLLARKQEWNQAFLTKFGVPQPSHPYQTIREVVESKKTPNKHLIRARVVDFWPFDLDDCFFLKCDKCQKTIRKEWKSCIDCGDFGHEYVRPSFRLFFCFLDSEGSKLPVSVTEDCPLLEGLPLVDPEPSHETKVKFRKRIQPLIGNVVDVHQGLTRDEKVEPRCDEFYYTICTWAISTGSKGYALVNYEDHL